MLKKSKKANFSAFWRWVCGAGGALGREKKREGYEFWPKNFEEEFRDHTEDAELKSSTPLPTKVGRRIEGPQGGTPPPPKFGKAFEEGKRRKGMSPRQETVPHLSNGVAECGKHNQRKAGGLEAPQSSLEASKSRLETPKSRPGGSKIEAWGLPNRGLGAPKSSPELSKKQFFKDI